MPRVHSYAVNGENLDSRLDAIARKLAAELRENIRGLGAYEVLSKEWLDMANSLSHIARTAVMQRRLPVEEGDQKRHTGTGGEGTLWDQQKDELAVRILLEEGKINLCLRGLHDFYALKIGPKFDQLAQIAAADFESDIASVRQSAKTFEESMGLLLRCALAHVESVQITDLPLLVSHCSQALQHGIADTISTAPFGVGQEALVLHYLEQLAMRFEHVEESLEDRVVELLEHEAIVPHVCAFLSARHSRLTREDLEAGAHFLAMVFAHEHFRSDKRRFLETPSQPMAATQKFIYSFKERFLSDIVGDEYEKKKKLRPVLHMIEDIELWMDD